MSSPVMIRSSGVISVENGNAHNMFIDENDSLWTFGRGDFSRAWNGGGSTQFPVKVIDGNVTQASGSTEPLPKSDGSLWAVGNNKSGALGDGTTLDRTYFVKMVDGNVSSVKAAYWHTLFLKKDGTLWAMGSSSKFGETGEVLSPVKISDANVMPMMEVIARLCL